MSEKRYVNQSVECVDRDAELKYRLKIINW